VNIAKDAEFENYKVLCNYFLVSTSNLSYQKFKGQLRTWIEALPPQQRYPP
jgi:hypothetical protein